MNMVVKIEKRRIIKAGIINTKGIVIGDDERGTYAGLWFAAPMNKLRDLVRSDYGKTSIKKAVRMSIDMGIAVFAKTGETTNFRDRYNMLTSSTRSGRFDQPACHRVHTHLIEHPSHSVLFIMYPWDSLYMEGRVEKWEDSDRVAAEDAVCREFIDTLGITAINDPAIARENTTDDADKYARYPTFEWKNLT